METLAPGLRLLTPRRKEGGVSSCWQLTHLAPNHLHRIEYRRAHQKTRSSTITKPPSAEASAEAS